MPSVDAHARGISQQEAYARPVTAPVDAICPVVLMRKEPTLAAVRSYFPKDDSCTEQQQSPAAAPSDPRALWFDDFVVREGGRSLSQRATLSNVFAARSPDITWKRSLTCLIGGAVRLAMKLSNTAGPLRCFAAVMVTVRDTLLVDRPYRTSFARKRCGGGVDVIAGGGAVRGVRNDSAKVCPA